MWRPKGGQHLPQEVAEQLRTMILRGRYRAGDKLPPERKLADTLGVNRATLREALKTLEQMGLVRSRQGDGTRVLDFVQTAGLDLLRHLIPVSEDAGLSILRDILEFRQIVGRELARLAAARAQPAQHAALRGIAQRATASRDELLVQDFDFYFELARATGNVVFMLIINPVHAAMRSFSSLFADFIPSVEDVRAHHVEIIAALERRDGDAACAAADHHLRQGTVHLPEKLSCGPEVWVTSCAKP
jgi:GntR family transcriptional regulator, transcriptional repressor for pyruvate dehydrogenase complex